MGLYGSEKLFFLLFLSLFVLQFLWLRLLSREGPQSRGENQERLVNVLFCICTALAVSTLFRLYPGNGRAPMEDSSAFLYIGQRMLEGKQPYRDLFDHKGPLLYLIQVVGQKLTPGSFTGVWLLEVLNMAVTAALLQRLAGLFVKRSESAFLAVLAAIGVCGWKIWQGGNFTEEYALPWISLAAYILLHFFRDEEYSDLQIIILGIGFAVVLLLRANMIAVWTALMPVALIILLAWKRYAEIGKCILLFLLGMTAVLLPVLIWARKAGFLEDMWRCYVVFNFRYTDDAAAAGNSLLLMFAFAVAIWPGTLAVLAALFLGCKRKEQWFNLIFFVLSLYTVVISGRMYYHYAIVLLPTIVLPLGMLFDFTGRLWTGKNPQREVRPAFLILSFCVMLVGAFAYRHVSSDEPEYNPAADYLADNTEVDDDVLVLGKSQGYYIQAGRKTENRFFYQLPPLEISQELRDAFKVELREHPSDYILLSGDPADRDSVRTKLKDVWLVLEEEITEHYLIETYDEFEIYIRQ